MTFVVILRCDSSDQFDDDLRGPGRIVQRAGHRVVDLRGEDAGQLATADTTRGGPRYQVSRFERMRGVVVEASAPGRPLAAPGPARRA